MVEGEARLGFPHPRDEFQMIGIEAVQLEGTNCEPVTYDLEAFCRQLPTAKEFAAHYGKNRVRYLLSRVLEQQYISLREESDNSLLGRLIRGLGRFSCTLVAYNYVSLEEPPYTDPLPYSVSLVLASQLTYGVSENYPVAKRVVNADGSSTVLQRERKERLPVNPAPFVGSVRYVDKSLTREEARSLYKSGMAVLVGANLVFSVYSEHEPMYLLRRRMVWSEKTDEQVSQFTIPGGHTLSRARLCQRFDLLRMDGVNTGIDRIGQNIIDVPYIRETREEASIPIREQRHARPLCRADQLIRDRRGIPIRFLAYIAETWVAFSIVNVAESDEPEQKWNSIGNDARELPLTPIATIAMNNFRY